MHGAPSSRLHGARCTVHGGPGAGSRLLPLALALFCFLSRPLYDGPPPLSSFFLPPLSPLSLLSTPLLSLPPPGIGSASRQCPESTQNKPGNNKVGHNCFGALEKLFFFNVFMYACKYLFIFCIFLSPMRIRRKMLDAFAGKERRGGGKTWRLCRSGRGRTLAGICLFGQGALHFVLLFAGRNVFGIGFPHQEVFEPPSPPLGGKIIFFLGGV